MTALKSNVYYPDVGLLPGVVAVEMTRGSTVTLRNGRKALDLVVIDEHKREHGPFRISIEENARRPYFVTNGEGEHMSIFIVDHVGGQWFAAAPCRDIFHLLKSYPSIRHFVHPHTG